MEIRLSDSLSLTGLRLFTKIGEQFDLGQGCVDVRHKHGGYMTFIPISPLSYRRENPTKASAEYEMVDGLHTFRFADDFGFPHTLTISDDDEGRTLVEQQKELLVANELMKEKHGS